MEGAKAAEGGIAEAHQPKGGVLVVEELAIAGLVALGADAVQSFDQFQRRLDQPLPLKWGLSEAGEISCRPLLARKGVGGSQEAATRIIAVIRPRDTNPPPDRTEIVVIKSVMVRAVEAAGIAPASLLPQVVTPQDICIAGHTPCLHPVCTDLALRELIARWQALTPEVRAAIMELVGYR